MRYYDTDWVHGKPDKIINPPPVSPSGQKVWLWAVLGVGILAALAALAFFLIPKPQWEQAVVLVTVEYTDKKTNKSMMSFGTGSIIRPDGYILTNKHVVFPNGVPEKKIKVIMNSGHRNREEYDAKLEKPSPGDPNSNMAYDWAILQITPKSPTLPYLPIGRSDLAKREMTIFSVGYPSEREASENGPNLKSEKGTITRLQPNKQEAIIALVHSAPLIPGNSGGPLLNEARELIGVNTGFHQVKDDKTKQPIGGQDNLAIPSQQLNEALKYAKDNPYK